MSVAQYFHELDRGIAQAYAVHLKKVIPDVATELCYGCQVDHPSQIQHDVCLMMDEEERIEYCLEKARTLLNESKILRLFQRLFSFDKYDLDYIYDKDWISQLWKNDEWRRMVCHEILNLG